MLGLFSMLVRAHRALSAACTCGAECAWSVRNVSLWCVRFVFVGRRGGNSVAMIEVTAGGRGEGRVLRAWRRRRVCSWRVGEDGSREWAARRQRRARRYFPAGEGQYIKE